MRIPTVLLALTITTFSSSLHAGSIDAVQTYADQMGQWHIIATGNVTSNNHMHGAVAIGGNATLNNASIAMDNGVAVAGDGLRVYGNLDLKGSGNYVLTGGASVVKNASVNTGANLQAGFPNPNQSRISTATGQLNFNGNGGGGATPPLTALASGDSFFASREAALAGASATLLGDASALTATASGSGWKKATFNAAASGVTVYNWDISALQNVNAVSFNFASTEGFIVINVFGGSNWTAAFNMESTPTGQQNFAAGHVLWNFDVDSVNLAGGSFWGSILAADTDLSVNTETYGLVFADDLVLNNREMHTTRLGNPQPVPETASVALLPIALAAVGLPVWLRRRSRRD